MDLILATGYLSAAHIHFPGILFGITTSVIFEYYTVNACMVMICTILCVIYFGTVLLLSINSLFCNLTFTFLAKSVLFSLDEQQNRVCKNTQYCAYNREGCQKKTSYFCLFPRPRRFIETIASFDQWSKTIENH